MAFAGPFSATAMCTTAYSKDSGSLTSPRLGKGCQVLSYPLSVGEHITPEA